MTTPSLPLIWLHTLKQESLPSIQPIFTVGAQFTFSSFPILPFFLFFLSSFFLLLGFRADHESPSHTRRPAYLPGPSEGVVGKFFQSRSADSNVVVTTKYCRGQAGMALDDVRKAINKSRKALGADALDLVAMHWWDFNDNGDVAVGKHLATLIGEGLLKNV